MLGQERLSEVRNPAGKGEVCQEKSAEMCMCLVFVEQQ